MTKALKVEGLDNGLNLKYNSISVCSFFESARRSLTPEYVKELFSTIGRNTTLNIYLRKERIYAPVTLFEQEIQSPVALLNPKIELVLFKNKVQMKEGKKSDVVELVYSNINGSVKTKMPQSSDEIMRRYRDPAFPPSIERLAKYGVLKNVGDDFISVTVERKHLRKMYFANWIRFRLIKSTDV